MDVYMVNASLFAFSYNVQLYLNNVCFDYFPLNGVPCDFKHCWRIHKRIDNSTTDLNHFQEA
jgi:hypothetical protein